MITVWSFLFVLMNFGISWWCARAVGAVWSESKVIGGAMRVFAVAGYAMAIAGFTVIYSFLLTLLAILRHSVFLFMDKAELEYLIGWTNDFGCWLLVMTVISCGIVIGLHFVVNFWRWKNLGEGRNSYAGVRDAVNASRERPSAFRRMMNVLLGEKRKNNKVLLVLWLMMLGPINGFLLASVIVKRADREGDLFAWLY